MEDLVFSCFNREASQVKAFVVAGGRIFQISVQEIQLPTSLARLFDGYSQTMSDTPIESN